MSDVEVTGLYPPAMDELSIDDFLEALPSLDEAFQQQVAEATATGVFYATRQRWKMASASLGRPSSPRRVPWAVSPAQIISSSSTATGTRRIR